MKIKVDKPDELIGAIDKVLMLDEPVIVDINTDPRRFLP
jgi:thiamine pyrophosphate-dependent acetolactate synthase large subunit-like protein